MKKVVLVGISAAALKAAQTIRAENKDVEILWLTLEGVLPYDRNLLADVLAKDIKENKIFLHPETYFRDEKIHVLLDKQITRINFKRKKIYTEQKDQIDYDVLILADTGVTKLPEIKGIQKQGIFALKKLKQLKDIHKNLSLIETVIIESLSVEGIKTALACQKLGRETILLLPSKYLLSGLVDEETAGILTSMIESTGVQVVLNNSIVEILGDTETKAVRLKSGKVLAAQMVIFGDTHPDLRLFNETEIEKSVSGLLVDLSLRTNMEEVYAVDQLAGFKDNFTDFHAQQIPEWEQQGIVAGTSILGRNSVFIPPVSVFNFSIAGNTIDLIGKSSSLEGSETFSINDKEQGVYKKVFVRDHKMLGAMLINAPHDAKQCLKWITEGITLTPNEYTLSGSIPESAVMIETETSSV